MGIQLIIDNPGQGEWVYAGTQVSAADPGTGQWKTNAGDTRIDISVTSSNGLSADSVLSQFETGAQVSVRVGGEDRIYTVSAATNNGTWHELTVSVASSSTAFALVEDDIHSVGFRWPKGAGGGGVTDHGALTGLADDDHAQYYNQTRGDARYNTQAEITALLGTKAETSDTRFPTADEKAALAATGIPAVGNPYVTEDTLDAHTTATANPHGTDLENLGDGLLAELNAAITDATLIDTADARLSDDRTPLAHTQAFSTIDGVPTNRILGRDEAGTGATEALTPTEAAALLSHANLGAGIGTNTHAQIDAHIASLSLEGVINATTPDNAVNVPLANPIVLSDNGVALVPLTVQKTEAGVSAAPAQKIIVATEIEKGLSVESADGVHKLSVQPEGAFFEPDASASYSMGVRTRGASNPGDGNALLLSAGGGYGAGNEGGKLTIRGGVGSVGATDGVTEVLGDLEATGDVTVTGTTTHTTKLAVDQLAPGTDTYILKTVGTTPTWSVDTGGGSALTVEKDDVSVATNVATVNIEGAATVLDEGGNKVTITVTPGSAPVASVFGRVDAVLAQASDYNASQIDNDATNANGNVTGAFVSSALDTADVAIEANTTATTAAQADADAAQADATAAKAKTDFLTVTGAVNLDTVLSDTTTNTSNVGTNATNISANAAKLANVATSITAVGAELVEDTTVIDQRATLGLGTAAVENVGVTIDDLVQLVNVGGNPGFPALRGDNLIGVPSTSTFIALTDVGEPDYIGHAGQVVKVNPGADGLIFEALSGGGDMLASNNLSELTATEVTAQQNIGVEVGVDVAAFSHTHLVLSDVDNTAGNGVILGRDTAGSGDSEELTPAEARAVIGVALGNLGAGTHAHLETIVADSDQIFAEGQAGQINALPPKTTPVAADSFLIEDSATGDDKKELTFANLEAALTIDTAQLADDAVTLAKMADMATASFIGRSTAATGVPEVLDSATATALLDNFSTSTTTSGTVPGSNGAAATVFLNATGAWSTPAGGGNVSNTGTPADEEIAVWTSATVIEGRTGASVTALLSAATTTTAGIVELATSTETTAGLAVQASDTRLVPKPDSVYIETPVNGDVINWGRADRTFTIARVDAVLDDGTSVVVSFDSGASRATSDQQHVNAQTCNSTTTGTNLTKTANLTIESGDWRWFTIGTVTGATGMTITVSYS